MMNTVLRGRPYAGNPHVRFDAGEVANAKSARWKTVFLLCALFAAGTLAAYQYIISGTPVPDPSEASYSAVVSLDARVADGKALSTTMETRRKAFDSGVCSDEIDLAAPGLSIIVR